MAQGTIDRSGTVTITFNLQAERLFTSNGNQLLPCNWCGHVEEVGGNVAGFMCRACATCRCGSDDVETLRVDHGRRSERFIMVCNACGLESDQPAYGAEAP